MAATWTGPSHVMGKDGLSGRIGTAMKQPPLIYYAGFRAMATEALETTKDECPRQRRVHAQGTD